MRWSSTAWLRRTGLGGGATRDFELVAALLKTLGLASLGWPDGTPAGRRLRATRRRRWGAVTVPKTPACPGPGPGLRSTGRGRGRRRSRSSRQLLSRRPSGSGAGRRGDHEHDPHDAVGEAHEMLFLAADHGCTSAVRAPQAADRPVGAATATMPWTPRRSPRRCSARDGRTRSRQVYLGGWLTYPTSSG